MLASLDTIMVNGVSIYNAIIESPVRKIGTYQNLNAV